MKYLLVALLWVSLKCPAQVQTQVAGWNAVITLPQDYNSTSSTYPTLVFFPGLGEIGNNYALLIKYGPHALISSGSNPLPGWIIISLQPLSPWPSENEVQIRLNGLKQLYRIDATRLNLTGLSMGGWVASTYTSNMPTAQQVNCVVSVQGVVPDDNKPYPQGFQYFKGSGYLCFEQMNDARGGETIINYLNSLHPGVGTFIQTNFNGGGHCCWNSYYGGSGVAPGRFPQIGNLTMYEWLHLKNRLTVLSLDTLSLVPPARASAFFYDAKFVYIKTTISTDYEVYNVLGQRVLKGMLRSGRNQISLTNLPIGMYYLTTQFDRRYKIYKWEN